MTMYSTLAVLTLIKTSTTCGVKISVKRRNQAGRNSIMSTSQERSILAATGLGSNAGPSSTANFSGMSLKFRLSYLKFSDAVKAHFQNPGNEVRIDVYEDLLDLLIRLCADKLLDHSSSSGDSSEQERIQENLKILRGLRTKINNGTDEFLSQEERELLKDCCLDFLLDNGEAFFDIFNELDCVNFKLKLLRDT